MRLFAQWEGRLVTRMELYFDGTIIASCNELRYLSTNLGRGTRYDCSMNQTHYQRINLV